MLQMNKEDKILDTATKNLTDYTGLKAHWKAGKEPVDAILYLEDKNIKFYVEVKRELRGHHLEALQQYAKQHQPFMVVAENIFPTLKKQLRDGGIAYLDAAGNIFYDTKNQYVWIEGNKIEKRQEKKKNRAFTKAGLRVVFQLLLNEETLNQPYREIAAMAGVALGNIKHVFDGLKELGFILRLDKNRMKLLKKRELLDRWIDGYGTALKPMLHIGNYRFLKEEDDKAWKKLKPDEEKTVWGSEAAADLITNYLVPLKLDMYTKETKTELMKKWRLIPDPTGKVQVYEKFWNNKTDQKYAPEILVYADLILTNDPRCMETAKMIYDKYLANEFV
jgi:hypothetical protein